MTSERIDYDALAATTSIEDMNDDCEPSQETLRSLKSGRLLELQICNQPMGVGEYGVFSDMELGWLGYFVKKNTSLVTFGIHGFNALKRCSEQAVDEFFNDLGRSSARIEFVYFSFTNVLPGLIHKLGPVMKNNDITRWSFSNCPLGNPEVTSLFGLISDMEKPNGLHIVTMNNHQPNYTDNNYHLDDEVVSECIPSLASKASMQALTLRGLQMGGNSSNALSTVFRQMADLIQLDLGQNAIDDDSVEILVRGLAGCIHLRDLRLNDNLIGDDGFDVLIQGLPASVDALTLARNEFGLDRDLSLLRFKMLDLSDNYVTPSGIMVVAASLANPECCLKGLEMTDLAIGDEGEPVGDEEVAIMARALQKNRTLIQLVMSKPWIDDDITESGWGAFSSVLCDDSSINATHSSNHTLRSLGEIDLPEDVRSLLDLNKSDGDKSRVAAKKILRAHRHLDMGPLLSRELDLLPYVVAWLERFAESRHDLKLSSFYEFVRTMPMKVVDRMAGKTKGKKRKLSS